MQTLKLHRTVGVRVGRVQVGGGAPVVVQSMTSTDTTDIGSHRPASAGTRRGRLRAGPRHRQHARGGPGRRPRSAARLRDAGLRRAAHRRLPLQRPPAAHALSRLRRRARQVPHQPRQRRHRRRGATSSSRPSARWRATSDKPVRIGVNAGSLNQDLVVRKMQENTDRRPRQDVRGHRQRVHGDLGARVDGARAGVRPAARTRSSSRARCRARAT